MKPENRFRKIIMNCQNLREFHGINYEYICSKIINKYSKEIQNKNLISYCQDQPFAKQLCMMNGIQCEIQNVPGGYGLLIKMADKIISDIYFLICEDIKLNKNEKYGQWRLNSATDKMVEYKKVLLDLEKFKSPEVSHV